MTRINGTNQAQALNFSEHRLTRSQVKTLGIKPDFFQLDLQNNLSTLNHNPRISPLKSKVTQFSFSREDVASGSEIEGTESEVSASQRSDASKSQSLSSQSLESHDTETQSAGSLEKEMSKPEAVDDQTIVPLSQDNQLNTQPSGVGKEDTLSSNPASDQPKVLPEDEETNAQLSDVRKEEMSKSSAASDQTNSVLLQDPVLGIPPSGSSEWNSETEKTGLESGVASDLSSIEEPVDETTDEARKVSGSQEAENAPVVEEKTDQNAENRKVRSCFETFLSYFRFLNLFNRA